MNEGVKILIERMKTNPEDFSGYTGWGSATRPVAKALRTGRFDWVVGEIQNFLNKVGEHPNIDTLPQEDTHALVSAYREICQQEFTDKVMKSLFADEESPLDLPHDPRMPNFSNPPNQAQNIYNTQYWDARNSVNSQAQHMGLGQQINGCLTNVSPTATTAAALKRTLTGIFR